MTAYSHSASGGLSGTLCNWRDLMVFAHTAESRSLSEMADIAGNRAATRRITQVRRVTDRDQYSPNGLGTLTVWRWENVRGSTRGSPSYLQRDSRQLNGLFANEGVAGVGSRWTAA